MDRLKVIRQRIYAREIERRHSQEVSLMAALVKDDIEHWDVYAARLALDLALHQRKPVDLQLRVSSVKLQHFPESDRTKLEEQTDDTLSLLLQGTALDRFLNALDEVTATDRDPALTAAAGDVLLTMWQHAIGAPPALQSAGLKAFVARDPWQIMHALAGTPAVR